MNQNSGAKRCEEKYLKNKLKLPIQIHSKCRQFFKNECNEIERDNRKRIICLASRIRRILLYLAQANTLAEVKNIQTTVNRQLNRKTQDKKPENWPLSVAIKSKFYFSTCAMKNCILQFDHFDQTNGTKTNVNHKLK